MRTFVCLLMLLIVGSIATACPPAVAVAVGVPQAYCPAPQADPVVNPPLGTPLRLETPQVYNQTQTQILRLATQDYSYNTARNVQLLRVDNGYNYRSRAVAIVNHGNVAIVSGRTRLAVANTADTVINVQSRRGLLGLRRDNVAVKVSNGGGPAVTVKAGGRGPDVSVKAGGGVKVQVKNGGKGRTRARARR